MKKGLQSSNNIPIKRKEAVNMKCVEDYQILQRNACGRASVPLSGSLPENFTDESAVFARVLREDDNSVVASWQPCEIAGQQWHTAFDLPEGGLYRLEACCRSDNADLEWCPRICIVRHVGVGDLYLLTGQSNMAGYGRDAAYDPPCLGVHLYANHGHWELAAHPLNDSVGTIYPENAEYTSGVSPALSFAKTLYRRLNVPIGLVQASLGGSPLSAWHPEEDGVLYRAMLRRLDVVGDVKGVVWYQGCADAIDGLAESYLSRFTRMVELWRGQIGPVPFLTAQLGGKVHWTDQYEEEDRQWGRIREAQRQAARRIPNVFVVPVMDLTVGDGIHNTSPSNVAIGERLAAAALCGIYHLGGYLAPDIADVRRETEDKLRIRFEGDCSVFAQDPTARGFDVEDAEGLIPCIAAETRGDGILLTTARPFASPARLHALWRCVSDGYFPRDRAGLPMLGCYGVEIEEKKVEELS